MTVPQEMASEAASKKAEREALRGVIQQWNANRLDLFELSEPNEDLEFHGVMRFYFQDSGQKVATKCIRVASDATTQAVIETLIEKFRPDMRMLSVPEYALYEIHENGEERKLGLEEKPLLVQLNWHIDDREGRFLLRRIDDKTNAQGVGFAEASSFRRKLSKREKKQIKKQEKLGRLKSASAATEQDENAAPVDQNGVAEKLYTELPETSFTRSISNPEAVMRRRRQQKLERKLQQFRSKDGGPDTGGTLKIYGEALCKDVPYKTLLLSIRDSAAQVVREMLAKYGLDKVDPQQYCLVQVNGENANGNGQEYILDDDECPLAILMNHPSTRGSIMFHVRRRPADYVPRKRKKKPSGKWNELEHRYEDERLPFLQELNPDGTEIANGAGIRHRLQPNVTEVGSERPIGPQAVQAQTITLTGPTVMPRHCVIAFTENIVTLTPCSRDAHTYVNNQRIHQTTILQSGAIIKFGRMHTFRFIDPAPEERIRQRLDSNRQADYAYDRRSPETTGSQQELSNSDKYRPGSSLGTSNGGQSSVPPSPSKSATAASPRSPSRANNHTVNSGSSTAQPEVTHNYETTFDLDGNVETASLSSSRDGHRLSGYGGQQQQQQQPRGTDPILPAVLEFLEETEQTFLHAVITDVEPSAPQFKLAPTYTLYLAARYRASTHYRPELQPTERAHRLTIMLANVATMIKGVIQERYMDSSSLALWLANGSELLHMLKSDRHVGAFSTRAQDILAEAVHTAFDSLVRCVSLELAPAMSKFMADADEPAKEVEVLQIFSDTMATLRRCRVNAALTIQLFSHLFHTINATAFNALVSNGNLCVRWFGRRLKARLNALETWAERQGLELASQCHLATIMQATHLLQAPKYNADELATLSSTCFKLNSLQVRALLQNYHPADDEPTLPPELIDNVVRVAESVADTLARADGREIRLEEEPTLNLALLLPEDGYSCEVIRGVPPGLAEFLAPLQRDGLCRMAAQPTSSGYWTIYMIDHFRSPSAMSNRSMGYSQVAQTPSQPEIQIIKLHKSSNGMGLSIVAAKGAGQDRLGIYIKSVVAGGAADADGRLSAGDQLLKVDGQSLVGITQEKAAEYLVRTGPIVTLEVAKQGAIYHGLATLLSQPSPVMTRAAASKARPKSEHFEPTGSRLAEAQAAPGSHSMGNLLSVPRHSAGQVFPREQYLDNWAEPHHLHHQQQQQLLQQQQQQHQPGASMTRIAAYQHHPRLVPSTAYSQNYGYHLQPGYAMQRTEVAEVYVTPEIHYDGSASRLGYWPTDEHHPRGPRATMKPAIREPGMLNHDEEEAVYCSSSSQQTFAAQLHHPPPQFSQQTTSNYAGYYTDDRSELVFPATRSNSEQQQTFCAYHADQQQQQQQQQQRRQQQLVEEEDEEEEEENNRSSGTTRDNSDSPSLDTEATVVQRTKNQAAAMPELNLDLSGINSSDVDSSSSNNEEAEASPGEVRLGCGRVAALAKHFSQLGDAGLIKLKSRKLVDSRRRYASEPDIPSSTPSSAESRREAHADKYKSESELTKSVDKSVATSPDDDGRDWDTILLDIEARGELGPEDSVDDDDNFVNTKEVDKNSKLSVAEQQQIIEQLKEFSNLDNADAPLFMPSSKKSETGNTTTSRSHCPKQQPRSAFIAGSVRLEQFRNHSLPTILSTLNFGSPAQRSSLNHETSRLAKINSLSKYWSLKDLASGDELDSNHASNDDGLNDDDDDDDDPVCNSPVARYVLFPTCSRVVSAPEIITDEEGVNGFHELTIKSTISIGRRRSDESASSTTTSSLQSSLRLCKSTNDVSQRRRRKSRADADEDDVEDEEFDEESEKSRSWEKLKPMCNGKSHSNEKGRSRKIVVSKTKAKSDLDVSERKPTPRFVDKSDKSSVTTKDVSTKQQNNKQQQRTHSRPRRMSERDLPSRLGHTHDALHSSKSVPALHNVGSEGKLQHEVFNPGYSRASSSNSVTPPVQPPPMPAMNGVHSLRSRSSQNLHDPSRGALPPSGLANRQQSSPNLNPSHPSHMQNNLQGNESERFYQNLSVYRNQDGPLKQQPSPPQSSDDRSPLHGQKPLSRGSESSLNRGPNEMNQGTKERPMSAYVGPQQQQLQQQGYPGHPMQQQAPPQQSAPVRSQSSRDIIRQEAKLQEMQEEVRRRELRGPGAAPAPAPTAYRSNTYNPRIQPGLLGPQQQQQQQQAQNSMRGRPMGSTPNLGPNSPNYNRPGYGYPDPASQQYAQQQQQQYNQFGKQPYGNNAMQGGRGYGQPQQNGPLYSNGPEPQQLSETDLAGPGDNPPARPALPHSNAGTPPPPVPNTLTHPLYTKQLEPSTRYTASMQDPPRGGYYPANSSSQQPRQYQFSTTDPWQREEREKEQARRREAARQWRDQQIAELSAMPRRTPQQEEQLRALQLERDFQKRAEEAASQQDDEEDGNDVDNEATSQRVQNLLRTATAQDRGGNHMPGPTNNGHPALTRSAPSNQSGRGALSPQSVNSQIQMTNVPIHTVSSSQQQSQGNPEANSYLGQNDHLTNSVSAYNQNHNVNNHQSSPYGAGSLNHSNASQKASLVEAEQRRIDDFKRRQSEFEESQRRRQEEDARQQQQMQAHQQQMQQQMYQQHQSNLRNQQQVHPGMLRLDNLIIEDPSSPNSQNNIEAPPPPERGSSYAVMSQQSALRSNTSTTSNSLVGPQSATMTKRVSFHDPNANTESPSRNNIANSSNTIPSSITMDTIREDPNNFINDAGMLLASPKTPDGPGGSYQGATPGVIGAQEVYKDPRQKRLAEKQRQQQNSQMGPVPEKLTFKEKMKLFAIETGEDGTPRDKVKISRAQREIDNIGGPLTSNNNN